MEHRYAHLLQPMLLRGHLIKNRMFSSCNLPHFLQGPEEFPAEGILSFVEDIARAGSAIVTIPDRFNNTRAVPMEDIKRGPCWNLKDPSVDNSLSQMVEAVHFQESLLIVQISKWQSIPRDADVCDRDAIPGPAMMTDWREATPEGVRHPVPMKAMTREQMKALKEEAVNRCLAYQQFGADGVCLHLAYRYNAIARFLSAEINQRTDEYGGCVENRARFPLEVVSAIREACGSRFLIEMQISGDGMSEEDLIAFARMAEKDADILQIRMDNMDEHHNTAYNYDGKSEPPTLHYAEIIKKAGCRILAVPNSAYHDPDRNEAYIAEGRIDAVSMARPFIVDSDYVRKIQEERPEDITPCLFCNRCHDHATGLWTSFCSVNPRIGVSHRLTHMLGEKTTHAKRVAVIGGGPAGMNAAIYAADAGHTVTIYEAEAQFGGQLAHSDFSEFKWALKRYKDYLSNQIAKRDSITVRMNCRVTPQEIANEGYDAVIAAVGAEANIPPLSISNSDIYTPLEVYGKEQNLGKRIAVVGGGETGTETGLYLAEAGHEVTVFTRQPVLAKEAWCVHAYALLLQRLNRSKNLSKITEVKVQCIENNRVLYVEKDGKNLSAEFDAVVIAGGVNSRSVEALSFYGSAPQFLSIGDCREAGNLHSCTRMALWAVTQL